MNYLYIWNQLISHCYQNWILRTHRPLGNLSSDSEDSADEIKNIINDKIDIAIAMPGTYLKIYLLKNYLI